MGEGCDSSCKLKCWQRVSETERNQIFTEFWKKTVGRKSKWELISRLVKVFKTKPGSASKSQEEQDKTDGMVQEQEDEEKVENEDSGAEGQQNVGEAEGAVEDKDEMMAHGQEDGEIAQEQANEEVGKKKQRRRSTFRQYHFRLRGMDAKVCKFMFMNTHDITEGIIESLRKLSDGGHISPDKRSSQSTRCNY